MPAYVIGLNRAVHDRQKLEEFWKAAAPRVWEPSG